ncbi:MAG: regulatory protein TetR [Actinomycetia bacterium]|nr:regulatory protein TetR [Actinomycetes bacterium]
MPNASSDEANVVPGRIAQRTLAARNARYNDEVRRLLDAALELMQQCGTTSKPRVVDIVAAAGLSNDAFYRHFASKDALVATLLDDGSERLRGYLEHQMAKEGSPAVKVARWVEGVLSQADDDIAATTLAVLWNGGSVGQGPASGRHFASGPLSTLLLEPFAALGSTTPELDASLVAHATFGKLSDYLWQQERPTRAEIERITDFCLSAVTRS